MPEHAGLAERAPRRDGSEEPVGTAAEAVSTTAPTLCEMRRLGRRELEGRRGEQGQGMIEYGLLVALISVAALAIIVLLGPQLVSLFQDVLNAL